MDKKFNILILRGLARQKGHWGDFIPELEKSPYIENVLCLDLPGFGDQSNVESPLTIHEIYSNVRSRFVTHRRESNLPWIALGVSLGGMILLEWAKCYPDEFKLFFIINSSSSDVALPWQRFHPLFTPHLLKAYPKGMQAVESVVVNRITNQVKNKSELIQQWSELAKQNPVELKNVAKQIAAASVFKAANNLFANVCFMASKKDRLVKFECSKKLSERYQAPLLVHATAGHELCLDDPKWTVEQIESQLNELN